MKEQLDDVLKELEEVEKLEQEDFAMNEALTFGGTLLSMLCC